MTIISILAGDFEVLMDDENVGGLSGQAGFRTVRRTATAGPTVYATNALYSAIAAISDDFEAMGFKNPMLPTTPNAYTMENQYFIPRSATEFLKEGAITGNWAVISGNGNGVLRVPYTQSVAFVIGDLGRRITELTSLDTGTLLDFEVEPDGTTVLWIRPDTAADTFGLTTSLSTTGGTGAASGHVAAISGISQWSAIQAIGSVPTATEVYLLQDRFKMTNSTGGFQWWATDPNVSLGIVSILTRVINAGVTIASGDLEVFARRYTSLYDNFRLNVIAGGFSALPLASGPDINNTTGYRNATWTAGTGSAMTVGDLITNTSVAGALAIVTAVTDAGGTGNFDYYLIGTLIDFVNLNTFTSPNRNGTIGVVSNTTGGPLDTSATNGGSVTIVSGSTTADHDGDAAVEPYSVTIDAQGNVPAAKVYERIKYVTRRGALNTDLFGAGVNVPGETYRGLEIQAQTGATGTFTEGDDIDIVLKPLFTARVISVNSTDTYVMLTDRQTSVAPLAASDIIRDESLDVLTVAGAPDTFTSPKASPFGTFTGTVIFGARGILFINPAAADTQNYTLTDDNGVLRTPPNTISYVVTNTIAGDRIYVARDNGTASVINKDQFGGINLPATIFNGLADFAIKAAGTIDSEVPQTGIVRIVETTLQQEHRYYYASRTAVATGVFTLKDPTPTTPIISTASTTQLIDIGALFTTGVPVEVGMLVRNTTAGKTTHVWEVTSIVDANTLNVTALYGPLDGTQDWDLTDTYTINSLIQNYATTDNLYDLIMDREADATSETNSFVKILAANFGTVVNVRNGKNILPFTQNQTQADGSTTVTVVRTPDTIAV